MSDSLKSRILRYIESRTKDNEEYINGGDIEREALLAGYKASNASRRLRELAREGYLWRREKNGCVEYRIYNA